jgi:hypothetical protein
MMLQIAPLDMDRAAAIAYPDRFAEAGDRRRIAVAARGVGDRACRGRR